MCRHSPPAPYNHFACAGQAREARAACFACYLKASARVVSEDPFSLLTVLRKAPTDDYCFVQVASQREFVPFLQLPVSVFPPSYVPVKLRTW
jgi:hypothetical protein